MKVITRILAVLVLLLLAPLRFLRLVDKRSPFILQGEDTGAWRRFFGPIQWVGMDTTWEGRELNWRLGPLQLRLGTWHSAIWWKHNPLLARYRMRRVMDRFPGTHFIGWEWLSPITGRHRARGQNITIAPRL